ncbi:MAG: c-type cytochrome, partial [Candidatus Methylomirabilales bacterium]
MKSRSGCFALLFLFLIPASHALSADADAVARGEYIFRASAGCTCHTVEAETGDFLAGGRAIETPFGTFYGTNITPDKETGIGAWGDSEFLRAMRMGLSPRGNHYFPVFPYTSFTRMRRLDLIDLRAYLATVTPVRKDNRAHEVTPPFSWRPLLWIWKLLNFTPGEFMEDPTRSPEWNRGAYLAEALGHCGECHTPRNLLGGLKEEMAYAGSREGPQGEIAPNITPDAETGIGTWDVEDVVFFLKSGSKPDGDDVQGLMAEMIDNGFKYLREDDMRAIAVYLRSLRPIRNEVRPRNG